MIGKRFNVFPVASSIDNTSEPLSPHTLKNGALMKHQILVKDVVSTKIAGQKR